MQKNRIANAKKPGGLCRPAFLCYNTGEVMNVREIKAEVITETVESLCIEACTMLGEDMKAALKKAESEETAPAARASTRTLPSAAASRKRSMRECGADT